MCVHVCIVPRVCVHVHARACMCVKVCPCVRACLRACVHADACAWPHPHLHTDVLLAGHHPGQGQLQRLAMRFSARLAPFRPPSASPFPKVDSRGGVCAEDGHVAERGRRAPLLAAVLQRDRQHARARPAHIRVVVLRGRGGSANVGAERLRSSACGGGGRREGRWARHVQCR